LILEGLKGEDQKVGGRVKRRLQKFHFESAHMLIQQRHCIEQYNLKWNRDKNCFEFPCDLEEEEKYASVDSDYLGKQKDCIIKSSKELLESAKAKVILNNMTVKKDYNSNVSNEIIGHLKAFLDMGKKVFKHKLYRE